MKTGRFLYIFNNLLTSFPADYGLVSVKLCLNMHRRSFTRINKYVPQFETELIIYLQLFWPHLLIFIYKHSEYSKWYQFHSAKCQCFPHPTNDTRVVHAIHAVTKHVTKYIPFIKGGMDR